MSHGSWRLRAPEVPLVCTQTQFTPVYKEINKVCSRQSFLGLRKQIPKQPNYPSSE